MIENSLKVKRPLQWFLERQGKKVFRTSISYEGLVYKIHFPKPIPVGLKKDRIRPPQRKCNEDSQKQFDSQDMGFEFYDQQPDGTTLCEYEI